MNYPKYYGNYLGIVVQNNDPAKRGRVKVFVPHISPSVYKKWTEVPKDKRFRFIGANVCSDITDILDDLKRILPWAELASPLAGESASGRYNAYLNAATISDSNDITTAFASTSSCEIDPTVLNEESQNLDNIGEKPGNRYDISYYKLKDAFFDPVESGVNQVNVYSYNYTPDVLSNSAKGSFPLLRVGAHVWVFFNDGDPLKPVVFAASFGSEDWKGIHDIPDTGSPELSAISDEGIDYPGTYENVSQKDRAERDINTETYRNKYVINQKGGTITFVNTDNKEVLKFSHYSGSFKEFNNYTNIELATANDQKLVLGDAFYTWRNNRNEYTAFDYDMLVKGDLYRKIGKMDKEAHQAWKDSMQEIADIKALFDIQRLGGSGTFDRCPVCNQPLNTYTWQNNTLNENRKVIMRKTTSFSRVDGPFMTTFSEGGAVPSVPIGDIGPMSSIQSATPIDSIPTGNDGFGGGLNGPGMIAGGTCAACGGSGLSPSSQGGSFAAEPLKDSISSLLQGKMGDLSKLEQRMGLGGSEIIDIAKNKIETIGLVMNDFNPIRIDPNGKMYISGIEINKYGAYYNRTPTPLIEKVHVDDLPGGTYTLNVCNRYNVVVGAGGLNLKSYGIVNISGAITSIAGKQVTIGSDNEVVIDGGKRVSITADVISIKQRKKKQTVVEGSLGVTHNLRVTGGVHVDGELTCNHITAPASIQQTGPAQIYAAPNTDVKNGNGAIVGFAVPLYNCFGPGEDGIRMDSKKNGGAGYIGITEKGSVVGRIPGNFPQPIGYIPVGTVATLDTNYNPVAGTLLAKNATEGGPPIPVPVPNTIPIPIFGGIPEGAPLGPVAGSIDSPCVFGTGIPNVRGAFLPEGQIATDGAGTLPINNQTAIGMPIVVYGTGADPDCILAYPHSHTFTTIACTLTDTNSQVRKEATKAGDAPNPANPVTNGPQNQDYVYTF